MDTVGIFECKLLVCTEFLDDPDINITLFKYRYRRFICEEVKFRNVLGMTDPAVLERIDLTYRLTFFKDTAIARWIDEDTNATLTRMIAENHDLIGEAISIIPNVENITLGKMSCGDPVEEEDALRFVLEICRVAKLGIQRREKFFQTLIEIGLVQLMLKNMGNPRMKGQLQLLSSEVLAHVVLSVPCMHNNYITRNIVQVKAVLASEMAGGFPSLVFLFNIIAGPQDDGLKYSVAGLLQNVLERDPKESPGMFSAFYEFGFMMLVDLIPVPMPEGQIKHFVLDIVTYFAKKREPFIMIPRNHLLPKAGALLKDKAKHVQLAAAKLMREVVEGRDRVLCGYINQLNLLEPILDLIAATRRDCLIVGTIRGLLKNVVKENKVEVFPNFARRYKDFSAAQLQLFPELSDLKRLYERPLTPVTAAPTTTEQMFSAASAGFSLSQSMVASMRIPAELAGNAALPLFYELCKDETDLPRKRAQAERGSPVNVREERDCALEDMKLGKQCKKKKEMKEGYGEQADIEIEINHRVGG